MIRTTVTFPLEAHVQWRHEALESGLTFSDYIYQNMMARKHKPADSLDEKLKKKFALFDEIGHSGERVDLGTALRKDRNRDET